MNITEIERPLKEKRCQRKTHIYFRSRMAGYIQVNRLSLVQLQCEERKHRAHLKKIADMQRRSGLDNTSPTHFPHVHNNASHLREKQREILRENDAKSKKILEIMQSKATQPAPTFHPTNANRRHRSLNLSTNNADYVERIAKTKGIYDVREWQRGFEEHKEHLKLSKDNKLFTPRDIGINRQKMRGNSTMTSRRTTPTSSTINMTIQSEKTN